MFILDCSRLTDPELVESAGMPLTWALPSGGGRFGSRSSRKDVTVSDEIRESLSERASS